MIGTEPGPYGVPSDRRPGQWKQLRTQRQLTLTQMVRDGPAGTKAKLGGEVEGPSSTWNDEGSGRGEACGAATLSLDLVAPEQEARVLDLHKGRHSAPCR